MRTPAVSGSGAAPRQASQTSSIGDIGPQMVVGTFMTFLFAAVWNGTTLMK